LSGKKKFIKTVIQETKRKRPLRRPWHRWKDDTKMALKKMWRCELDSAGSNYAI